MPGQIFILPFELRCHDMQVSCRLRTVWGYLKMGKSLDPPEYVYTWFSPQRTSQPMETPKKRKKRNGRNKLGDKVKEALTELKMSLIRKL